MTQAEASQIIATVNPTDENDTALMGWEAVTEPMRNDDPVLAEIIRMNRFYQITFRLVAIGTHLQIWERSQIAEFWQL